MDFSLLQNTKASNASDHHGSKQSLISQEESSSISIREKSETGYPSIVSSTPSHYTVFDEFWTNDKDQNGMLSALSREIQNMRQEERKLILEAIKKNKKVEVDEDKRKQTLKTKIKAIISRRPTYPEHDPNNCYICGTKFWHCFSRMSRCSKCKIIICNECLKIYKEGNLCYHCAKEILYRSNIGAIDYESNGNHHYIEDNLNIAAIESMLLNVSTLERLSNISRISNQSHQPHNETVSSTKESGRQSNISRISKQSQNSHDGNLKGSDISKYSRQRSSEYRRKDEIFNSSLRGDADGADDDKTSLSSKQSELILNFNDENIGEVMIGLTYALIKKEFQVIVKKCRDLPIVLEKESTTNPYVKVVLIPQIDGEPVRKTPVKKFSLNPVYNVKCKFKNIIFDELMARSIMISVYHHELAGTDIFIGYKLIRLNTHSFEDATAVWYKLENIKSTPMPQTLTKYIGDILFSIKYSYNADDNSIGDFNKDDTSSKSQSLSAGCITLWIKQANNLISSKYNIPPSSYAKCTILPASPGDSKKKTHLIAKSFNPIWNTEYKFLNISEKELKVMGLEITLWDKKMKLVADVFLGGISMNLSRDNKPINQLETEVWTQMIEMPEKWIEAKLLLRDDLR